MPATAPDTENDSTSRNNQLAAALQWDWGTAYEMLLSLYTIFRPKEYGLPAPWAAGVRKRLSPQGQQDLKDFYSPPYTYFAYLPLHLVLEVNQPKNATRFLDYMESLPDDQFSRRVHLPSINNPTLKAITSKALSGETLGDTEVEEYRKAVGRTQIAQTPSAAEVRRLFGEMANPTATKRRWLSVIREYHATFFAEEEKRVGPVLQRVMEQAQAMSGEMPVPEMIERLSNGFTISKDIDLRRLVLVPSIWLHPFVARFELGERELFVAWGARPPGYKLVPGESVPDDALLVLRALSDPTRLRLMRLIASEPRSLISLSQEVKLSLPTVSHHIRELRGAGLIRLEVGGRGRESKYTVRWPSAQQAFEQLEQFVMRGG
jgi:DNA-binding transcriptional ArsR family regulator